MGKVKILAATAGLVAAAALVLVRRRKKRKKVVISGACGNLGTKLGTFLTTTSQNWEVVGIEHPAYVKERPYKVVEGDLTTRGAWEAALSGADVVVHFSAVNPYPNATWKESAESMSHGFNLFLAAEKAGVRRLVLASSNHVYGGYKDDFDHGPIQPSDEPRCGTALLDEIDRRKSGDAVAYAAAKLAQERFCKALAERGRCECLVLRVGWCQPGENRPETMSAAGTPTQYQNKVDSDGSNTVQNTDDIWFRHMWLSNDDFLAYFTAALTAPLSPDEHHGFAAVSAMSANSGARWALDDTVALLGVTPKDDASKALLLQSYITGDPQAASRPPPSSSRPPSSSAAASQPSSSA